MIAVALTLVAVLADAAKAAPYSPPSPPAPGALVVDSSAWGGHGSLAFVSRSRLYVLDAAGHVTKVTGPPTSGFDSNPAWSPDGGFLAFLHTGPATGWAVPAPTLWELSPGSPRARPVTSRPVSTFHWAPSSDVLAYLADASSGTGSLWRQGIDPSAGARELLSDVSSFLWSPSGNSIAALVENQHDSPLRSSLQVVPTAGPPVRWWTSNGVSCVTLASWAPTGSEIAAWIDDGCYVDADGEPLELIAPGHSPRDVATTLVDMSSLAWSPNGKQLAVVSPGDRTIWANGKDVEICSFPTLICRRLPIPSGTVGLEPAWSAGGDLYFITASGSGPFATTGSAYYSAGWIARWEQTSRAWKLPPGAEAPSEMSESTGSVLAFDPSHRLDMTLLV